MRLTTIEIESSVSRGSISKDKPISEKVLSNKKNETSSMTFEGYSHESKNDDEPSSVSELNTSDEKLLKVDSGEKNSKLNSDIPSVIKPESEGGFSGLPFNYAKDRDRNNSLFIKKFEN